MLVLTRKNGEAIIIDGNIRIEVKEVSGGRVRLLVDAPRLVRVDREEVWLRKKDEAVTAGTTPSDGGSGLSNTERAVIETCAADEPRVTNGSPAFVGSGKEKENHSGRGEE